MPAPALALAVRAVGVVAGVTAATVAAPVPAGRQALAVAGHRKAPPRRAVARVWAVPAAAAVLVVAVAVAARAAAVAPAAVVAGAVAAAMVVAAAAPVAARARPSVEIAARPSTRCGVPAPAGA